MRIAVKGLKELQPKQQAHCGHLWTSVTLAPSPSTDDSGGPLICCYVDDVNGVEVVHRSSK
jgi:hypothetical protein